MKREPLVWVLLIAALVGIVVSGISLNNHYSDKQSFCTLSEKINCDVVNKGPYSELLGIPVAFLGLVGYLIFCLLAFWELEVASMLSFDRKDLWPYLALFATAMLAFALYLTALEALIIHAWCILCITSQIAVLVLAIGSWTVWHREK
jgi:uncharacterized membrane protein